MSASTIPGFARTVVAIDDGQSGTGEARLLVYGERIHMLNFAKVPESDDRVTDRRRFDVRGFERLALESSFADREELGRVGTLHRGDGTKPTQGVALPCGTVRGPRDKCSESGASEVMGRCVNTSVMAAPPFETAGFYRHHLIGLVGVVVGHFPSLSHDHP